MDREGGLDKLTVLVEVSESVVFDEMKRQRKLEETIVRRLATELGVTVDVKLVGKKTLGAPTGRRAG